MTHKTMMYSYPTTGEAERYQTERQIVWLMVDSMRITGRDRFKVIASPSIVKGYTVMHLIADER